MSYIKLIFIVLGTISLGFGVIGIIIPGLPTTPFLLLTAVLYLRGSERLYRRVISNPFIGRYIHEFQMRKGLTLKVKIYSILLMWLMISCTIYFFMTNITGRITLITVGLIGTFVMGLILPTIKSS